MTYNEKLTKNEAYNEIVKNSLKDSTFENIKFFSFWAVTLTICIGFWLLVLALSCKVVYADVNMDKIAMIESSMNPLAHNKYSNAKGLYQITPICLKDYNQYHTVKYTHNDMYNPQKAYKVANWYANFRIPQLLKYYGHIDNDKNRLISYNCGISCVGKALPTETKNYITKYKRG